MLNSKIILILTGFILMTGMISSAGGSIAYFNDTESSGENTLSAWSSNNWTQTMPDDFESGIADNVSVFSDSESIGLSIIENPEIISSENSEVYCMRSKLIKTLSFDKCEAVFDEIRIDTNLRNIWLLFPLETASEISIFIDDEEVASHSTNDTGYKYYSDVIDTNDLTEGTHQVKLYMKSNNILALAGNSIFEIFRIYAYAASGSFSSPVLDTEMSQSTCDAIFWDCEVFEDTNVQMQMRADDTSFAADSDTLSWINIDGAEYEDNTRYCLSALASGQYKQWRALLTSDDVTKTPLLEEVRLYFSGN
jgi:predicted ribosomally synthesized peptide with SipW-like signal peptide